MQLNVVCTTFQDLNVFLKNNLNVILDILKSGNSFYLIDTSGCENYDDRIFSILEDFSDSFFYVATISKSKQAAGRNLALDLYLVDGYVWFVDSDDIIYSPSLPISGDSDIVINDYIFNSVRRRDKKVNGSKSFGVDVYLFLLLTNRIPNSCWCYFYSVKFLKGAKIKFENIFFEDLIFNASFFSRAKSAFYTGETVYEYIYNSNSTSHNLNISKRFQRICSGCKASIFLFKNLKGMKRIFYPIVSFIYHALWCNLK